MEVGNIVKGHINEVLGLNTDISTLRVNVCRKCPLYKSLLGGMCNPKLWLNPETGDVRNRATDGYYRGCGCLLKNKVRSNTAHCPAKKW